MGYEDLQGRNVLITGGASGIGLAVARAFSASRSNVAIVDRNKEKLDLAKKEVGGNVSCFPFDLNEIDRCSELIGRIVNSVGEVDVLVNCAGVNLKKAALAISNQEYKDVVQTNQTAVFALTREVAKSMVARRTGSIIMISSMASQYGIPEVIAYTASKSAVEGMTRALAVEWSPFGVRVNCIAPGFIVTPMSSKALDSDPERKKRVLSRTPMGRLGEPSDVANAALFLASEQSKYITGIVLPVDGGNSIGF
ncbi:MAG TPA: 3-oxoacyl-ACP reductase [Bacteroidetes bacterium]|nr:3-oxoacyl-ACP reductase [Bacteroidota bacterium]